MNQENGASNKVQLQVGDETISYSLTFSKRKTVGITVHADQSVHLRAPLESDPEAVAEIVRKRAQWIVRQQQKFAQLPPKQPPHRFEAGETHRFLGRQYLLKLERLADAQLGREQVRLDKNYLRVWARDPQAKKRVEALVERWYRQQANLIFARRLAMLLPHFKQYPIPIPELAIRRMKARWGSCGTNGVITLNLKLIQVDEALIDYVIMHELCHLIEHNHSKHFYALLDRMLPDWRQRRQRLNEAEVFG